MAALMLAPLTKKWRAESAARDDACTTMACPSLCERCLQEFKNNQLHELLREVQRLGTSACSSSALLIIVPIDKDIPEVLDRFVGVFI